MELKAKASNPGLCAFAPCKQEAWLIYRDTNRGYDFRVCSRGHAEAAGHELDKIPAEYRRQIWPKSKA